MSKGPHEHEKFIRIVEIGYSDNGEYVRNGEELQWVCIQCGEIYHRVKIN